MQINSPSRKDLVIAIIILFIKISSISAIKGEFPLNKIIFSAIKK